MEVDRRKEQMMNHCILKAGLGVILGLGSAAGAINTVSFGEVSYDGQRWTAEILWTTSQETLAGFQIAFEDTLLTGAGGGLAEDNNWSTYLGDTMVLSFAMALEDYIAPPLDPVVLIEVEFEAPEGTLLAMSNLVFANEDALKIEVDATDTVLLDSCPTDYDGDGTTNVNDLLTVIAGWNDPYTVDDLLDVIGAWGGC